MGLMRIEKEVSLTGGDREKFVALGKLYYRH